MKNEEALLPCPFCGSDPFFEGDVSEFRDGARHVELALRCCATMTQAIGWRRAWDMTVEARTEELRVKLTDAWNRRAP